MIYLTIVVLLFTLLGILALCWYSMRIDKHDSDITSLKIKLDDMGNRLSNLEETVHGTNAEHR